VIELKKKYTDCILMVECGYKYRFFGEDAETASKVLNVYAFMLKNFMSASIPVHRLDVHVRRLVQAGYKVGIVKQTETAALKKVSENKNQPFTRELVAMYTPSTLTGGDLDSIDVIAETAGFLVCIREHSVNNTSLKQTSKLSVEMSMIAVHVSTANLLFDTWIDTALRPNLEARLRHLKPAELILQPNMTRETNNIINYYASLYNTRVVIGSGFENVDAVSHFSVMHPEVRACLAAVAEYLDDFPQQKRVLQLTQNLKPYSKLAHMQLGKFFAVFSLLERANVQTVQR
jgi:DNA mismatch repair protein MSH3